MLRILPNNSNMLTGDLLTTTFSINYTQWWAETVFLPVHRLCWIMAQQRKLESFVPSPHCHFIIQMLRILPSNREITCDAQLAGSDHSAFMIGLWQRLALQHSVGSAMVNQVRQLQYHAMWDQKHRSIFIAYYTIYFLLFLRPYLFPVVL